MGEIGSFELSNGGTLLYFQSNLKMYASLKKKIFAINWKNLTWKNLLLTVSKLLGPCIFIFISVPNIMVGHKKLLKVPKHPISLSPIFWDTLHYT